jgi:D-xylose transport system substrate-binding protein
MSMGIAIRFFVAISTLILLVFSSCEEKKSLKIGFLIDSFETARWQKDKKYFEDRVKELGGEVVTLSAQGDENLQYKQAEDLINQGVKVLVLVASNTNTAASIVRKAHSKGVKVLAYARMIPNSDLDYYVSFNVEKIGELQAKYVNDIAPHGNYVLINGDKSDINAIKEYTGVQTVLGPLVTNNQIEIHFSCFIDGWIPADAAYYTAKVLDLSFEKIDAFIVANDGMAEAVSEVLKARKTNPWPIITGLDADKAACARILSGEQSMTIYMSIKNIATTCAEIAMQLAQNKKIDKPLKPVFNGRIDVPSIILDPVVVDKNNIESTVVAEGYHTMDEIRALLK